MPTIAQTVAGTTIGISAALPATYDAAGFGALTYTPIGEVSDIGSLGREYSLVTHNPVGDRNTYKFRGSYNSGSLALKFARATLVSTNAGQTLLNAAALSDTSYSYKITFQDGGDLFFTAKNMGVMAEVGGVNSILGGSCKLEIDSNIVETA